MSEATVLLEETWQTFREQVDARLEAYVEPGPECPDQLHQAIAYSLLSGGKRLRPLLVLLAAEACGGDIDDALSAACAVEMVHAYSLIHDDLPAMDDDELRRGRPTNHVVFGEATAILAGDGLLTLAFEVMARDVHPAEVAAACCAELAQAAGVCGMVGGQAADLEAERNGVTTVEQLELIHRRKTGRLLAAAPAMGARIAGAHEHTISELREYGNCVGLAFQIADDLLDVSGDAVVVGKGVRKDAAHGKATYPALLGVEESRRRARQLIERACRHLEPLGHKAQRLESLAEFVIERDH